MKLNLMKQFFDSVDDEWHSPIADEIAERWFEADFQAYCLRASANFTFLVKTGEQKYLLRFNHARERRVEYLAGELAYIEHLVSRGIHVAKPLPSLSGNLIESVETSMGLFHGTLFEFLPGEHREMETLDETAIKAWGRALGEMHRAGEGFEVEGRPGWREQIAMIREFVPQSEILVWQEAEALEKKLRALPINQTNYGLIHFDFEPDNIVWSDGRIGIFDLDDCAWDWFVMDIANALSSELFDDQLERYDLTNPKLKRFLEGYRSARRLHEQEVQWLPLFLRLDNLISFARVYRSIADGPVENEPEWTADLRLKLARELDKYRDSFRNHPIQNFLTGAQ